jgi:hypothetical protein
VRARHAAAEAGITQDLQGFRGLIPVSLGRALLVHRLCLYGAPLLIALIAALMPPDANFDLASYHTYNPWAFLSGRGARDLAPNGIQSYFNPLLDVPFYWMNGHLPGRVVAFILGLGHGACFVLLYLLARAAVFRKPNLGSVAAAAGVAVAGITAGVSIAELGTTFYDYLGCAGLLLCLLLLARHLFEHGNDLKLIVLAGAALGLTVGLKLTNVHFAAGVGAAVVFLELESPLRRRLAVAGMFAAGGLIGVLAGGGFWMVHLWQLFGDPIFPFFNNVFHSSYAGLADGRDTWFMPRGLLEAVFYPFIFTFDTTRTIEFPIRDFRFLALCLAVPAGAALLVATRKRAAGSALDPKQRRYLAFLLIALAVSYVVWLGLFSIRRYALGLEMLAPLVIAMIAQGLPRARTLVTAGIIGALVVTTGPVMMRRGEWHAFSGPIVDVQLPATPPPNSLVLLTGWGAKTYVAPYFPADASFVTVGRRKIRNLDYRREVSARIESHRGPIFALVIQPELASLSELTDFGLAAGSCRPIRSTIALDQPVMLCDVRDQIAAK